MPSDWMFQIHACNPYDGFPAHEHSVDLQGWGYESPIFDHVISVHRPSLMIEVGTWKGASAIRTARLMKLHQIPNPQLICVDTWLGSVELWTDPVWRSSLAIKHGRPELYKTFMTNVIRTEQTDVIVPFPVDTSTAAKFFQREGMQADAVYLDASHEQENVAADLIAYWQVLRPSGVLFGDDYAGYWPGVIKAVREFTKRLNLPIYESFPGKFLIIKPSHSP